MERKKPSSRVTTGKLACEAIAMALIALGLRPQAIMQSALRTSATVPFRST